MKRIQGCTASSLNSSDANTLARSQRFNSTLLNRENFGVTAFGYQNEVGRGFRSFGEVLRKKEFATAGSSTTKAGGNVRLGPSVSVLHKRPLRMRSQALNTARTSRALQQSQQEVNATFDLPKLSRQPGRAERPLIGALPVLWASQSYKHPSSDQGAAELETSTSFGGSWTWDSVKQRSAIGATPPTDHRIALGRPGMVVASRPNSGIDHSSLVVDLSFSYGHTQDVAEPWQAASVLYDSSVTLSYKRENLPPLWATAAVGNFDYNSLWGAAPLDGVTAADLGETTRNEYWSIATGIDLLRPVFGTLKSHIPPSLRNSIPLSN